MNTAEPTHLPQFVPYTEITAKCNRDLNVEAKAKTLEQSESKCSMTLNQTMLS